MARSLFLLTLCVAFCPLSTQAETFAEALGAPGTQYPVSTGTAYAPPAFPESTVGHSGNCDAGECSPAACSPVACDQGSCDAACGGCDGQCGVRPAGYQGGTFGGGTNWDERAMDPPGMRQRCKKGKLWPVAPRPQGPPQTFCHKFHHAHYWPHPYNCWDRHAVNGIMDLTIQNGWEEICILHSFHFNAETGELSKAGQMKLAYIANHAPVEFRRVYVNRPVDEAVFDQRVAGVRQSLVHLTGSGDSIAVLPTVVREPSRPATEVENIYRQRLSTMPVPQIASGGGGGGGGGNAAGASPAGQ